jgi:DNA topoisomerase-1
MLAFAGALPRIRARAERDLRRPKLDRERVLATVVRLLESTLVRVGNEEYARTNRSFGPTTLRTRHVAVRGGEIRFSFRGKGGKEHTVGLRDPRLARIVRRLHDLPGQELFQYVDDEGLLQQRLARDAPTRAAA